MSGRVAVDMCRINSSQRMPRYFAIFLILLVFAFSNCLIAVTADTPSVLLAPEKPIELRIGVLAFRGFEQTKRQWTPLAHYLSSELSSQLNRKYKFKILPLTNDDIDLLVEQGKVDFVLTNPASYALLEMRQGLSRIATIKRAHKKRHYSLYGAVIFTRSDNSSINRISDLKNKSFMAVHAKAFGGWWMAKKTLLEQKIDPEREFKQLSYSGFPHESVVNAVLSGKVDAGTVRTGTLEHMIKSGKIKREQIKVLNQQKTLYFPFLHSTQLYPDWPFAVTKNIEFEIAKNVTEALLDMPGEHLANELLGIKGWTAPLNYKPVHELLQYLQVGPYHEISKISIEKVLKNYWVWMIFGLFILFLMILVTAYILGLNKRLIESNSDLKKEIKIRSDLEKKLKHLALYDSLTDIPNRTLLADRMQQAIYTSTRESSEFAVAIIDLDNFKQINDQHGHHFGDQVIQQVAQRFSGLVRKTDTIARMGGDEFVMLVRDVNDVSIAITMLEKCIDVLQQPVKVEDKEFLISASIGISRFPYDAKDSSSLLQYADIAMYNAKRAGKGVCVYSDEDSSLH